MNVGLARRVVHARHGVAVEIALLDDAVFRGDFAEEREAGAEGGRAFELLQSHFRIDDGAGVNGGIYAADFDLAVLAHLDLHDGRDVGQEAAVNREAHAEAIAVFLLAPARFFRGDFEHAAETSSVDGIFLVVAVVVGVVLGELGLGNDAIGAEQRQDVVVRILPGGVSKFIGE